MDSSSAWRRARIIGLTVLALALWQSRFAGRGAFPGFETALTVSLVLIWAVSLFGAVRADLRPWMVGLMLLVSAALVRVTAGMAGTFIAAVGLCGYSTSWRRLHIIGVPLVLSGALWLNYPLPAGGLAQIANTAVVLVGALLLGRISRDRQESRADQAKALSDLQRAHEELQVYTAQVEELSTLRERNRLGRDLHDTLGHALSAITVQLEAARRMQRRDPAAVEPMLIEAQTLARQAMQELRQYLAGLRTAADSPDLPAALQALAGEAADRNGWRLTLEVAPVGLSDDARRALLQIAREAITNIERHAHAKAVSVRFRREDSDALLAIDDDGRGFVPGRQPSGHYGLQGMRERLAELGGQLMIDTRPEQGTKLTARLPIMTEDDR